MDVARLSTGIMDGLELLDESHPDVLTVSPEDSEQLTRAAEEVTTRHGPRLAAAGADRRFDDPDFLVAVEIAARQISPRLLARIVEFRLGGSRSGILALHGLPVDVPLPPTPHQGVHAGPWHELVISSVIQLMVMGLLGDVTAYADEKRGRLIQDVCPVRGAETRQENTGSCLLELHTEDGFHPYKPAFLSLYCLRGDHEKQALTVVGSIRAVLPDLPEHIRRALRRPDYRIGLSSSFTGDGPKRYSPPLSVLSGPPDDPELCLDLHAMEALTDEGAAALTVLSRLMVHKLLAIKLVPGAMMIVDNRLAVHGRTAFQPRFDGTDRWLRRCYAVADLRASRRARFAGSRVHRPL